MRSETANRILSETTEETKQKVRETANRLVMENKLVSMTDFVLAIDNVEPKAVNFSSITDIRNYQLQSYGKIVNHANFLKQPLKLGMFVPCDENDVPLKKPFCQPIQCENCDCLNDWEQAKDRVLFEGFELVKEHENAWTFRKEGLDYEFNIFKDCTIEELQQNFLGDEITLTASAIKQFEL